MTATYSPERLRIAAIGVKIRRERQHQALSEELAQGPLALYVPDWGGKRPSPKQAAFLALDCSEAFYGGAAGGGKSDALLMAALQYVDVPGYAALLLRRTYPDLVKPGALLSKAKEWLGGTSARWSERDKTFYFPSSATVSFGYLQYEDDKYHYQSSEYQFVAFDEATHFTHSQYRYVGFSRRRRPEGMRVPLRTRAASNPDGVGFDWVKQRFVDPGSEGVPFIEAHLDDNPGLDKEAYIKSLEQLDPVTRMKLLDGDWSARAGGNKFQPHWFEIVDVMPAEARAVRFWDLASTEPKKGADPDYTVGCLMGKTADGLYYIADIRRDRLNPGGVEALVRQTAELDGKDVTVYMEQEPGASGKAQIDHYTRNVLSGFSFYGIPSTGSKELRANPLSSQAYAGNVKLVRGRWNAEFLDEVGGFPEVAHDDQVDGASGAFGQLAGLSLTTVDPSTNGASERKPEMAGVRGKSF